MGKATQKPEHDSALAAKALAGLSMRVVVAAYIVYMAWKVLSGALKGGSPIPTWGAVAIFAVFAACAVAFCVYSWRAYKKALVAAELPKPHDDNKEKI